MKQPKARRNESKERGRTGLNLRCFASCLVNRPIGKFSHTNQTSLLSPKPRKHEGKRECGISMGRITSRKTNFEIRLECHGAAMRHESSFSDLSWGDNASSLNGMHAAKGSFKL